MEPFTLPSALVEVASEYLSLRVCISPALYTVARGLGWYKVAFVEQFVRGLIIPHRYTSEEMIRGKSRFSFYLSILHNSFTSVASGVLVSPDLCLRTRPSAEVLTETTSGPPALPPEPPSSLCFDLLPAVTVLCTTQPHIPGRIQQTSSHHGFTQHLST